ncbi:hypothetical protein F7734_10870 [Scytonema sp. UIC 10036]|uniref:hypothetical protein n=1 Tax=Scytonema sp. UIC 10036 TaxID=2304196 RepID=UPI0012DA5BC1|nr:hypothetical protein [Scytonema sp. UIC 10036]MUG92917.1 hypothetical protein [Scytonema sp. UIC 10036]
MMNPVQPSSPSKIKSSGVRSSAYGIKPFPQPEEWAKAMKIMAGYFPNSTPIAVWGIGEIIFDGTNSGMKMGFPNPNNKYDNDNGRIRFSDEDEYEKYLSYFDSQGIKVFLQVEPGYADIKLLIDATFKQYGHHSCAIGFGIDVEWYQSECDSCKNQPVTDELAKDWEETVKSYNPNYKLFLKHYDKYQLPPTYRGDLIFINDSQGFANYDGFLNEMIDFANQFPLNPVMFQIGYDAVENNETGKTDKFWWERLPKPIPQTMGRDLAQRCSNPEVGVIWVDFTLREVVPI